LSSDIVIPQISKASILNVSDHAVNVMTGRPIYKTKKAFQDCRPERPL
jgi:hypothetical protein